MSLQVNVMPSEARKEDKRFLKLKNHKDLFNPNSGAVVMVFGSTGSGKTSWLWSYLNDWTPKLYDECIIFSGTADSNDTWEKLKQNNVIVLNSYDDAKFRTYLHDLEQEQDERRKSNKDELKVAVVFDDFVCDKISNLGKPTALDKLVLTSRHLQTTVFILSQKYRGFLSPSVRKNAHYLVIYKMPISELKAIGEEHGDGYENADEFAKVCNRIVGNRYEYMVVETRNPPEKRYRNGMTERLIF
jgi:hypothetical protein